MWQQLTGRICPPDTHLDRMVVTLWLKHIQAQPRISKGVLTVFSWAARARKSGFIFQWCCCYLRAEESCEWCLQRLGAHRRLCSNDLPRSSVLPTGHFPDFLWMWECWAISWHCLLMSWHAAGAGACIQTGWGHKLQSFGTFKILIKIVSLKDPTVHTVIILFWFSRSVVVSVFVSIHFIVSAADFKREHKWIFWLFDQLLGPNTYKGIPNNCFHVGDILNISKNMNLMVYFTNIFFLTFPESAGLLQSLQEKLCL